MRFTQTLALLLVLVTPQLLHAQSLQAAGNHAVRWTVVGAGAGFGVGLTTGLAAFDDAIDSDRKVWTTAIVGAAVGGTIGYLVGRHHHRGARATATSAPSHKRPRAPLDDRVVRQLAAGIRLDGRPTTQW